MQNNMNHRRSDTLIWVSAFILANLRGTVVWEILKQRFQLAELPWIEVLIWLVLSLIAIRSLRREKDVTNFIPLWRHNWILILFSAIALLSLAWSVSIWVTLYRSAALVFSSFIGAYLGFRYSLGDLLNMLFRFGAALLILCFVVAAFLPVIGAMGWEPYDGAWRGIFWHKNQLGSVTALFSLVFLISALDEIGRPQSRSTLYFAFYAFSAVVIYFSKSVAGYFLFMIVSFGSFVIHVWLKIRHRLTPVHYYSAAGLFALALAILVLNLDLVFGLFNRDTSLTGRLPLWSYLIGGVFTETPWLGHGFGAIWSLTSFRTATQELLGWGFPVVIGDNGFLDILLHVGLIGFIPFLGVLFLVFVRALRFARREHSLISFFPLLLMIYAVFANISFSLFLETETFLWLVIVSALFLLTKSREISSTV